MKELSNDEMAKIDGGVAPAAAVLCLCAGVATGALLAGGAAIGVYYLVKALK